MRSSLLPSQLDGAKSWKMSSKRKRTAVDDAEVDVKPKRQSLGIALPSDEDGESQDSDSNTGIDMSQAPDFSPLLQEEAEVGIIEQVMVRNFMCHNVQDIKFGSRVNFLIGRNGSGKSAILTAIVVGLGGKATVTNRGSSIRNFVKTGKQTAEVVVKLRNRGQDAYKPEEYGKTIIVERKISKDTSSYRIKNSEGKLVSNKHEELSRILEHFNIQVDNPLVILNQDTSRNFLNSKSPHDKYKFFLKATQLEQIKQDYISADESKEVAKEMLKRKCDTLPIREKEVYEWEQKFKALASLQELKAKMEKLKVELIWACISEREKGLEPIAKELRMEEARTPKFENKVAESEREVMQSQEKHGAIEKDLTSLGSRVEGIEPRYMAARSEKETKKKVAKTSNYEMKKVERDIAAQKRDKDDIQTRIVEIQNSAQKDYESETRARKNKIAQLEGQMAEIHAKKRNTELELTQFKSEVVRLKQSIMQAKAEQDEVSRRAGDLKRHLQTLEGSKTNRLRRFGSHMPQLIQKIDDAFNRGLFHKKPVGPLAAHFTLKDQKWALAVEACLKSLMMSFCVHDHHDERQLENVMKSVNFSGGKPQIITSVFNDFYYDTSRNRVKTTNYPTVLDVLNIENPIIANCLVDQLRAECILLIEDQREARRVMSENPPQNTHVAFNKEGDQIYCNPFKYYSNTEEKVKLLVQSVEDDIRRCKRELTNLEVSLKAKRDQQSAIQRDLTSQTQEERKTLTCIMRLQEQSGKVQMELNELMNIEEPTPVDVETLKEEEASLEVNITKLTEILNTKREVYNKANSQFMEAEKHYQELDVEMTTISEQGDTIRHQLAKAENSIQTARNHKSHYETKMKEHLKKIADLKKKLDKYEGELKEDVARAEQVAKRVRTKRTSQNLESEIKQIGIRVTAEEKLGGNHEEITKNYYERRDSYLAVRHEVAQLETFLKALDKVMNLRQCQYAKFRRMVATRAKFFFIVMLNTRKYSGKMEFDHKKESLDLQVKPTVNDEESGTKDMRSLSGGERSFSTVCFILALWDVMESPFRCLDEFDVFMDMVNRRISMDMMMTVAQNQKVRQFIFLTPQSMSNMSADRSMIKIFEMRAPERGQGTLPFAVQNGQNNEEDEEENTPAS